MWGFFGQRHLVQKADSFFMIIGEFSIFHGFSLDQSCMGIGKEILTFNG